MCAASSRHHATTEDPQLAPWSSGPSPFAPPFSSIPLQLGSMEQDQWACILVGPPPQHIPDPAIITLPTPGTEDEANRFKKLCMHMGAFSYEIKRVVVLLQKPMNASENIAFMNLALAVCGYPKEVLPAIKLVSELTKRCVTFC